jgi:hypothetical protein
MLYVEAVLYVTVAAAAFGLGYLAGRGGSTPAVKEKGEDADVAKRVPLEGKVFLTSPTGTRHGDKGAVVIVVPVGKLPDKPLPIAGLRPDDPISGDGKSASPALVEFGGRTTRADASGAFTLFVPEEGNYHFLFVSGQAREIDAVPRQDDLSELGKYFEAPADLLQRHSYRWLSKDIRGGATIDQEFPE